LNGVKQGNIANMTYSYGMKYKQKKIKKLMHVN